MNLKLSAFAILTSLHAGGCTSGAVPQQNFSVYSGEKSFSEVISVISDFASKHGYTVHQQIESDSSTSTTSRHVMLEGDGVRVLFVSALMEQCKEKEGRRDVEYSPRVFDVSVFSTSWFPHEGSVGMESRKLTDAINRNGLRVVTPQEACQLL